MSKFIFLLSFIINFFIIIQSKRVTFFKDFTYSEKLCPSQRPITNDSCKCNPSGSTSYNWIKYHDKTDIPFGPDDHYYRYFQMSSVITELSPDGFVLLSEKYSCPDDVEACAITISESSKFSVTSDYTKLQNMDLEDWNLLLRRNNPSASTSSYECILEPNTSGYLAIRPMMEKVLGWTYGYSCNSAHCWPGPHPCSECPKIFDCDQSDCHWLGKAPKINPKDGSIVGQRRCIVADSEDDALRKVNDPNVGIEFVRLPHKVERIFV